MRYVAMFALLVVELWKDHKEDATDEIISPAFRGLERLSDSYGLMRSVNFFNEGSAVMVACLDSMIV